MSGVPRRSPPGWAGAAPTRSPLGRHSSAVLGCVLHAWLLAAFVVGLSLAGTALRAATPSPEELERRVQTISDQLRCPTCQAISVKDSEAAFSVQIRDKVRHMVEEGQSDDQIRAYFVARYGEWILRAPPKEGVGLIVWVLPLAAMLAAGAAMAWTIVRRSKAKAGANSVPGGSVAPGTPAAPGAAPARGAAATPGASVAPLTSEQRERVQADLKRFEEED